MLPVNYAHFEKIYIITQEDDTATINLCKTFDNVIILYFDFKNNGKQFDKFGALNYAQNLAYTDYPESWYLIIDSDIILPNNLIDILSEEQLNAECLYGPIRNDYHTASELLNKPKNMAKDRNNLWILCAESKPPLIFGFFQLYKKKIFHLSNYNNASAGDSEFGLLNFNLFCCLKNLYCLHLGKFSKNWNGKVVGFVDDINLQVKDLYYKCYNHVNNITFSKNGQVVKYGNSANINDDTWTYTQ